MRKPIKNTLIAISMFSATFGAVNIYKSMNNSNMRTIASVENPVIAEFASADFIKEQKVRMEEVTLEMKNANGDMIKVTKKLVEIETKLSAQMKKGTAYANIEKINELKSQLAKAKGDKGAVEKKMAGLKVKHKEAIDGLAKINDRLAKEIFKADDAKKKLAKKIADLEASGNASAKEISKLRANLDEKNEKSKNLNLALNDLSAQVDAKNIALAQAVSANDELNKSIEGLNDSISKLNNSIEEKDQKIIELDTSFLSLQQDHTDLKSAKEELDQKMAELSLISEMQEEQISMKEEEINVKNEAILEKDNTISCQQEEIKINTDKITELQALINDSTNAIKESKDAIKSLKEEKEERVERIAKLEKENKAYKSEKKEFDAVLQMMMANFMQLPQMMASFMNQGQMNYAPNMLTNPLTGYGQQVPQTNYRFGGTGMRMQDPYAAPQFVTNNYYPQQQPYGGFSNDYSIRDMFKPESTRNPSGYYSF